jgi:hypothetical protein
LRRRHNTGCTGFHGLAAAGRDKTKITTAVGHELLGFICAIGTGPQTMARQFTYDMKMPKRGTLVAETRAVAHMLDRQDLPCFADDILPIRTPPNTAFAYMDK